MDVNKIHNVATEKKTFQKLVDTSKDLTKVTKEIVVEPEIAPKIKKRHRRKATCEKCK